ncbi:uncharacterized protein BCR38DRAFT_408322 [Pseudomassariella vexata]|uniref:Uncharacterized protein n=1 Tax=Pseudomassariella vexata TaxID=1141098 RepID=A0A1Y2E4D8_9PEZI|nr:uncharacterized protein BCR38DRAFT_408322 [Pseudomassariella vexata]ORY66379.1 hypothetical protein BCR38DRAFT_408322 [Pseudomassariella vexata]
MQGQDAGTKSQDVKDRLNPFLNRRRSNINNRSPCRSQAPLSNYRYINSEIAESARFTDYMIVDISGSLGSWRLSECSLLSLRALQDAAGCVNSSGDLPGKTRFVGNRSRTALAGAEWHLRLSTIELLLNFASFSRNFLSTTFTPQPPANDPGRMTSRMPASSSSLSMDKSMLLFVNGHHSLPN